MRSVRSSVFVLPFLASVLTAQVVKSDGPKQLGLKLESQRAPVEVLVVDKVERPTPD
jgi:hypothetical protein